MAANKETEDTKFTLLQHISFPMWKVIYMCFFSVFKTSNITEDYNRNDPAVFREQAWTISTGIQEKIILARTRDVLMKVAIDFSSNP